MSNKKGSGFNVLWLLVIIVLIGWVAFRGLTNLDKEQKPKKEEAMIIEPLPQIDFIVACDDVCSRAGAYGSILMSPDNYYYCSCSFYPESIDRLINESE